MLGLLSLPEGTLTPITNLLPTDLDYAAMDGVQFDTALNRWAAVARQSGISWSPDGQRLAYSGAQDGPSSDLYVYSLNDDESTRLTDGPTETVLPTWSPDGQRIVHGAVTTLNFDASGIGYDYASVWSAEADGAGVNLLFATDTVGFENILGWLDESRFLHISFEGHPYCPERDLRMVDLDSGEITQILEGRFNGMAFDQKEQTMSFGVVGDASCDQTLSPGIYVLDLDSADSPLRIAGNEPQSMAWLPEAEQFFIRTEFFVLAADRRGKFIELAVPETSRGLPIVAPRSRRLAWIGEELWVGELTHAIENKLDRIFAQQVREAGWSRDGEHLLFSTNEGIYVASEPDFEPIQVSNFRGADLVWVLPRSGGD